MNVHFFVNSKEITIDSTSYLFINISVSNVHFTTHCHIAPSCFKAVHWSFLFSVNPQTHLHGFTFFWCSFYCVRHSHFSYLGHMLFSIYGTIFFFYLARIYKLILRYSQSSLNTGLCKTFELLPAPLLAPFHNIYVNF